MRPGPPDDPSPTGALEPVAAGHRVDHPARRTRVALAVTAGVLLLVGVLVAAAWAPLLRTDEEVTGAVTAWMSERPGLVTAAVLVTDALGPWPLRTALVVLAAVLAWRGLRRAALWVVAVTVVGSLAGGALKLLVSRDRPAALDPLAGATGFAWPSGHASTAALAAGVLVVLATPATRRWLVPVVVSAALLVGATRVLLGVHWTSDVLAGWLLAASVVLAAVAIAPPYGGRETEQGASGRFGDRRR